jgi:hypothetical protein
MEKMGPEELYARESVHPPQETLTTCLVEYELAKAVMEEATDCWLHEMQIWLCYLMKLPYRRFTDKFRQRPQISFSSHPCNIPEESDQILEFESLPMNLVPLFDMALERGRVIQHSLHVPNAAAPSEVFHQ